MKCNVAITSATAPNTEFLNSAVATARDVHNMVCSPASHASDTGEYSIAR